MKKHLHLSKSSAVFLLAVVLCTPGFMQTVKAQTVTLEAGSIAGDLDGTGSAAQLNGPRGITQDASGNIYFTDLNNNKIKKMTPSGVVATYAGTGAAGATDGTLATATFTQPAGICFDNSGNLFVTESGGARVRMINTTTGMVSVYAGSGVNGNTDGTGTAASFFTPTDIVSDNADNLYVSDYGNNSIRKIAPGGVVTTYSSGFNGPHGLAINKTTGDIYVANRLAYVINRVDVSGNIFILAGTGDYSSNDGVGVSTASFRNPVDIDIDAAGNLYVVEDVGRLRRINMADTVVTTIVGGLNIYNYNPGQADSVMLSYPTGLSVTDGTNIYIAELLGHKIKKYNGLTTSAGSIENTAYSLQVFPNPAHEVIYLQQNTQEPVKVAVYDMTGKMVKSLVLQAGQAINISELKAGIYVLKSFSEKENAALRFIKD